MVGGIGRRQETQAFLFDQLHRWARRREEHHVVAVQVTERRGELDGVGLGAAQFESMGEDEDFQIVTSHGAPVRKKVWAGATSGSH